MRALGICLFALLYVSGCGMLRKSSKEPPPGPDERLVAEFNSGVDLLGREKYAEASAIFEKLVRARPATDFDMVVLYNSGAAFEGLKACTPARDRYRKVVTGSEKNPRLQAQALHRLSFVYECLGEDTKVVSSLLDAWKRRAYLPADIGQAEVPARLAAAYARVGNFNLAQTFLKEAEKGLKESYTEARTSRKKRELLARTLFFMGRVDSQEPRPDRVESYVMSVRLLQRYLIQSVSLDAADWSAKSADQIVKAYDEIWRLIPQVPAPAAADGATARRMQKSEQVEVAKSALVNLNELKAARFPDPNEPRIISSLYAKLSGYEQRLQKYLADNADVLPLTPEAEGREGLRREGKVRDSAPTPLEKKAPPQKLPAKTRGTP